MAGHFITVIGKNADGSAFNGQMWEADIAPTKRVHGPWAECARCGYVAPQAEMTKRGALFYCSKYGCATEART